MTLDCPLCNGLMRSIQQQIADGTMLRCLHCGAAGTSNLVVQHLILISRLQSAVEAVNEANRKG